MRAVGAGRGLWRVEVVLWTHEPEADQVQELLNAVAEVTYPSADGEHLDLPDVGPAWSYDVQPPEGGVGVAFWVRSDTVGGAADRAWTVVQTAAVATLGAEIPLWDLRVIPREAIIAGPGTGTPLVG